MACDNRDNSDDDELARLLAADARRHFGRVVEAYQHRLYTFAYRLTGSQQTAEDIVQEAFVRAYVACLTYPQARVRALKLQPWLYKITLHEFHHAVRGARLHVIPIDLADDDGLALDIEDAAAERPDMLIESQEQLRELEAAVARLPERYRIPVACCYFERLSYQEIADLLDQPLGTVKSAVFRGVRLLRTMLSTLEQDTRDMRDGQKGRSGQDGQEGKEGRIWSHKISDDKRA